MDPGFRRDDKNECAWPYEKKARLEQAGIFDIPQQITSPHSMNRNESIKLWLQGKEKWNAWAEKIIFGSPKGKNPATKKWIADARADFSSLWLRANGQPEGREIEDEKTKTLKSIFLDAENINFTEFIFPSDVSFENTVFDCGDAYFISSRFRGVANFGPTFNAGQAGIPEQTVFSGSADFKLAHFEKPVSFRKALFKKSASFASITSEKSFNLYKTGFAFVPDFNETSFHAPPVLDDIAIAPPLQKRPWRFHVEKLDNTSHDIRPHVFFNWPLASAADEARKFRALAKMASEAKDYQNEMEFFAQEQRCRRFWHDRPGGKNAGRFWLGWLYEKLSDFGRSFARPFLGWVATLAVFALVFAGGAKGTITNWLDPVYLSVRHGLIISDLTRSGHMKDVLDRLYGANLPDLVSFAMLAQPLISAIWLFLLLLALRNQFKIK